METQNPQFYEFGEYKLDSRRRILLKSGSEVSISAKNYDLLFALISNEGKILTHNELLDLVWGDTFVEQSNLKKGISALRQILGETPESSLFIKTIPRKGYSFITPVRTFSDEKSNQTVELRTAETAAEKVIIDDPRQNVLNEKSRTNSKRIILPILIVVCLLVVTVFGWWILKDKSSKEVILKLENLKVQRLSTNGNVHEAAISSDGKFFVYALLEDGGKQSLWMRKIGTMNPLQIVPAAEVDYRSIDISPDGNNVFYATTVGQAKTILYSVPIFGGSPRKTVENISSAISFSPDGKRISFVRDNPNVGRDLITANTDDGSDEKIIFSITGDNHGMISPKWSPDGSKFVFVASEKLPNGRIWRLSEVSAKGGNIRNIIEPRKGKIFNFSWLQDGKSLVMVAEPEDIRQSQLWRVNYANGEITRLTNDILDYQSISVSSDGRSVLTIQNERKGDLWSIDLADPTKQTQISRQINFPNRFVILPDGNFLAESIDGGQQTLSVIDAEAANSQPFLTQPNNDRAASISPDRKTILFISRRSGSDQIWKSDLSGRNLQKLTDEKTFIFFPRFSPDSSKIFYERYNGTRFQVVQMPTEGGEAVPFFDENSSNFDFSPDGTKICYGFFDEQLRKFQVKLRNLADATLVKTFDVSSATFLHFTPDGKNIIFNVSDIQFEGGNLWIQPLDGSPARPLIELKDEKVFWAQFSTDGKKLFFTRGQTNSSIVLLNNTEEGKNL